MNRKIYYISASILAIVLMVSIAAYVIYKTGSAPSLQEPSVNDSQQIKLVGTIGCLTPKDNTGVQDMSCAIGLKADSGKSYAISSDDPTVTGSIPSGQRVEVSGSFTAQSSKYDSEGIVRVTSIKRL